MSLRGTITIESVVELEHGAQALTRELPCWVLWVRWVLWDIQVLASSHNAAS